MFLEKSNNFSQFIFIAVYIVLFEHLLLYTSHPYYIKLKRYIADTKNVEYEYRLQKKLSF